MSSFDCVGWPKKWVEWRGIVFLYFIHLEKKTINILSKGRYTEGGSKF